MRWDSLRQGMMRPINTSVIILLGIATLSWGIFVAMPMWDVFSRAQVYQYLAYLPEVGWGIFAIVAGLLMIRGVLVGSYKSLTMGSWIGFMHWFVIDILYWAGDWQNTAGITVLVFVVYSAFIHINLKINRESIEKSLEE